MTSAPVSCSLLGRILEEARMLLAVDPERHPERHRPFRIAIELGADLRIDRPVLLERGSPFLLHIIPVAAAPVQLTRHRVIIDLLAGAVEHRCEQVSSLVALDGVLNAADLRSLTLLVRIAVVPVQADPS